MSESRQQSWLARADRIGRLLETWVLVGFLAVLLVLASSQILLRNVFSSGIVWADAVVRLAVLWIAVIGAVAASRDRRHIAVDIIARNLSGTVRRGVTAAVHIFTGSVAAIFAWQSWRFVQDSRLFGDVFADGWPAWWIQIILPAGFAMIAYRYLVNALVALFRDS